MYFLSPAHSSLSSLAHRLAMRSYLALLAALLPCALADTYTLSDNYVGSSFLSQFVHEAIADPTHGRVSVTALNTVVFVS